jgi:hypothetical protein
VWFFDRARAAPSYDEAKFTVRARKMTIAMYAVLIKCGASHGGSKLHSSERGF